MEIRFEQVDFTYQPNTPFENRALFDLSLTIESGSYTALVGHTGSGKSTLLQHMNALLKPTSGTVTIGDRVITPESNNKKLKAIREKVGIVFQFPESQLFEESVLKDIAFGPMNFGKTAEEAQIIAKEALGLVGLDQELGEKSPFDLSGGQMRRVAIAGILAMRPDVLVLDEPTAGLDPRGRLEMMSMFDRLHREQGITIVLVTHLMDDVANYADHVIVLENGHAVKSGTPEEVFADTKWLVEKQLGVPTAARFAEKLMAQGFVFDKLPLTEQELADQLEKQLGGAENVR